jgi:hypothetical protein
MVRVVRVCFSDAVKLKAITEALDRGGLAVKSTVEVGFSVKPHEAIYVQMMGGSRSEHRGEADNQPALVGQTRELPAVDAEIVLDDDDGLNFNNYAHPMTPAEAESGSVFDSEPSPMHRKPPSDGLMPMEQANAVIADQRRAAAAGHAQVHRTQRALPPGRGAR